MPLGILQRASAVLHVTSNNFLRINLLYLHSRIPITGTDSWNRFCPRERNVSHIIQNESTLLTSLRVPKLIQRCLDDTSILFFADYELYRYHNRLKRAIVVHMITPHTFFGQHQYVELLIHAR